MLRRAEYLKWSLQLSLRAFGGYKKGLSQIIVIEILARPAINSYHNTKHAKPPFHTGPEQSFLEPTSSFWGAKLPITTNISEVLNVVSKVL